MTLLLGLDLGTSSAKAVLYDPALRRVVAQAGAEYPIARPQPGYAEQSPADWWAAAVTVTRRALLAAGAGAAERVIGIGLSGQMHGTVLLDAKRAPLGPAIIWADQRAAAYVDPLLDSIGQRQYVEIAGTRPAAGFMVVTLLWLAEHDPARLRKARTVLLPKDYLRLRLTGDVGTDFSDAAATGLFDIAVKTWSAEIVRAAGIARPLLPKVSPSTAVIGTLTADAAEALGLRPGVPVTAGSADQPAQAIGNGITGVGRGSVTVGSGGQIFLPIQPVTEEGVYLPTDGRVHVFNHAVPGLWYILGATLSAGLSLRWLRDLFGFGDRADAYAAFSAEAATVAPGADGLIFLPHLAGERTPHMDSAARGAFIGLTARHTRAHLVRAVMEGVAFSLRQALEVAQGMGGTADSLIASGGGMDSDLWRGLLADTLDLPLHQRGLSEYAALGAALIAGVGVKVFDDFDALPAPVTTHITEPDRARAAHYADLYHQYVWLYPKLREDFQRLSAR